MNQASYFIFLKIYNNINQSPIQRCRTGRSARLAARAKRLTGHAASIAPTYLQANLIVLPSRYADDFRLFCARNPVPCPLLAESAAPGDPRLLRSHLKSSISTATAPRYPTENGNKHKRGEDIVVHVAEDIDLRHDFPRYRAYQNGELRDADILDISAQWTDDHVGFLTGCSYSSESALVSAGHPPRHQVFHKKDGVAYHKSL